MDIQVITAAIVAIVAGTGIGVFVGKSIFGKAATLKKEQAEKEAEIILEAAKKESENIKKEKILEAKEKYQQYKNEQEKEFNTRVKKVEERELTQKQKEQSLNQKIENYNRKEQEVETIKENLNRQLALVNAMNCASLAWAAPMNTSPTPTAPA